MWWNNGPRPRERGDRRIRRAVAVFIALAAGLMGLFTGLGVAGGEHSIGAEVGHRPAVVAAALADPSVTSTSTDTGDVQPAVGVGALATTTDTTDTTPSHYYVWNQVTAPYKGPRDSAGVILTALGSHRPLAYNPTGAAEWAIHFYENWLHTGDRGELDDFLVQAKWLRGVMDSKGRFPYRYPHIERGIKPPWYSAMAQGLGTSVLLRAYAATGQKSYLAAAERAVGPFGRDVKRGGVATGGGTWLEEYPDSHHVLNGSIFASFGLWDMMRVTRRLPPSKTETPTVAQSVWAKYTANLAANLGRYESHGAILYELETDHYCYTRYFDLHLRLLQALTQLTGDTRFSATADRWSASFHAYPDPEIAARCRPGGALSYAFVTGTVRYLYRNYYGAQAHATISLALPDGTLVRKAVVPITYGASGDRGAFTWAAPATSSDSAYVVTIAEQPKTPVDHFDYTQHSRAAATVPGFDAVLLYCGPSGLEAFDAWRATSSTSIAGMTGGAPDVFLSPSGQCVVTMQPAGAGQATPPAYRIGDLTAHRWSACGDASTTVSAFVGWADGATAVFRDSGGGRVAVLAADGSMEPTTAAAAIPASGRATTAWDRAYRVAVNGRGTVTVTTRDKNALVSRFTLPRPAASWHLLPGAGISFSPDGKWMAYEVTAALSGGRFAAPVTYVVGLNGSHAQRMRGLSTGFTWAR